MKTRLSILATLALVASGCGDDGPQGPGTFTVSLDVTGPPAGAVIFDVTGDLSDLQGTGDTRVFNSLVDATAPVRRVIAVSASGVVGFRMSVDRVELGAPQVVVVDAAGTDNGPRGPAGLTVRIAQ